MDYSQSINFSRRSKNLVQMNNFFKNLVQSTYVWYVMCYAFMVFYLKKSSVLLSCPIFDLCYDNVVKLKNKKKYVVYIYS